MISQFSSNYETLYDVNQFCTEAKNGSAEDKLVQYVIFRNVFCQNETIFL